MITEDKSPEIVAYVRRIHDDVAFRRGAAKAAQVVDQGKVSASLNNNKSREHVSFQLANSVLLWYHRQRGH